MAVVSLLMCAFIVMKLLFGMGNTLDLKTALYMPYTIKPSGCENTFNKKTIVQCAVTSFKKYQPLKYVNGECKMCPGDQVTNLTFDSEEFYFPKSHSLFSRQTSGINDTAAAIQFSRPLTPGTVIYLAVTPLANETFFEMKSNTEQTPFHLYIRFNTGLQGINTFVQDDWGTEECTSPTYPPFVKGQRTNIHVLLTLDRFVVYYNKVFHCEYMYRLPLSDVVLVHFIGLGDSLVHELSL